MIDREKVIKGLKCCSVKGMNTCKLQECPYYPERYEWNRCTNHLATDALAMLKEQEPKPVKNIDDSEVGIRSGFCSECQKLI